MQRFLSILLLLAMPAMAKAQQYYSFQKQQSDYTELTDADYTIPESSQLFGNINLTLDFDFNAFGSSYNFAQDGCFVVMKSGYFYLVTAPAPLLSMCSRPIWGPPRTATRQNSRTN